MTAGLGRLIRGHHVLFGACIRCGRNGQQVIRSKQDCDGHVWEVHETTKPRFERLLWCKNCYQEHKIPSALAVPRNKGYENHGSPCSGEPPASMVATTSGPKNPTLKGGASAQR